LGFKDGSCTNNFYLICTHIDSIYDMYGSVNTKDKTILVCRLAMWLICTFLRIVWGGGKGEGYSSCRYAPVPNLIILSVRYDSVLSTLRISLVLNSSCVPSRVIKALSCGQYTLKCSVHSDQKLLFQRILLVLEIVSKFYLSKHQLYLLHVCKL